MIYKLLHCVIVLFTLLITTVLLINFVAALKSSFYGQLAIGQINTNIEHAFFSAKKSFELRPKEPSNANRLGNISEMAFAKTQNPAYLAVAVKSYAWAVRDEPQEALNHYLLGIALLQVNQTAFSTSHFNRAINLEPNNPIYIKRGK